MRPRYVLFDKDENRLSLKTLNLTIPVEFKEIEISEMLLEIINSSITFQDKELIISTHFENWINSDFQKMINSGKAKIKSFQNVQRY